LIDVHAFFRCSATWSESIALKVSEYAGELKTQRVA